MNSDTYDQIIVPAEVIGDQSVYLQEGMNCVLSIFNGIAVGIQLPATGNARSCRDRARHEGSNRIVFL